jgi:hypothetical protein
MSLGALSTSRHAEDCTWLKVKTETTVTVADAMKKNPPGDTVAQVKVGLNARHGNDISSVLKRSRCFQLFSGLAVAV